MALLPLLALSALLLGSAAGLAGVSPEISGIVDGLADICLEAAGETVTAEVKAEVRAELRGVQRLMTTMQEQLTTLQERQTAAQGHLTMLQERLTTVQEQLLAALQEQQTAVQGKLTAVQHQLTTIQDQQTTVQQRLPPPPPAARDCPANWTRHGDSCYLLSAVEATWRGAHQSCATRDPRAHLVSIHASNKGHVNSLAQASGKRYVWTGLFRLSGDGWAWTDGTPVDYTDWVLGQPDNQGGRQDCVDLNTGLNSQWFDDKCSDTEAFMCQIRLI